MKKRLRKKVNWGGLLKLLTFLLLCFAALYWLNVALPSGYYTVIGSVFCIIGLLLFPIHMHEREVVSHRHFVDVARKGQIFYAAGRQKYYYTGKQTSDGATRIFYIFVREKKYLDVDVAETENAVHIAADDVIKLTFFCR